MIFILSFEHGAGTLVGLAIGDAMGAPLEGLRIPEHLVNTMQSGGIHHVRRGHFTDDTLQAIAIARSLVACGGLSPMDVIRRLIGDYVRQPWFYGPTSSQVFNLIRSGVAPERAAQLVYVRAGGGRSNGSVMRGAPLGVVYPPEEVWEKSLICARLTHAHPVAGECSAFFNSMVSDLCRGSAPATAFSRAIKKVEHPEVREVLGDPGRHPLTPSLDALDATHCAVSIVLGSVSFRDAVVRGINLGGDADTIGALCGALAGARWGVHAIPAPWLAALHRRAELLTLSGDLLLVARP